MASVGEESKVKSAEADSGVGEQQSASVDNVDGATVPTAADEQVKSAEAVSSSDVGTSRAVEKKPARGSPLLRPSAFNTQKVCSGGGLLAPGKLTLNPFATKTPPVHPISSASDSEEERPIVAPSHFNRASPLETAEAVGVSVASPSRSILRPSALDKQTVNFNKAKLDLTPSKTSFVLKPATLESPLTKVQVKDGVAVEVVSGLQKSPQGISTGRLFDKASSEASKENYFAQFTSEAKSTTDTNGESGFVFGQNMGQRVENAKETVKVTSSSQPTGFVFGQDLADRIVNTPDKPPQENQEKAEKDEEVPSTSDDTTSPKPSLEQSAAAHQAKQAKPEYQEVQVSTGEENESNVFQIYSKLFVFDKAQHAWSEKGRGLLRLNDMSDSNGGCKPFASRLVMRTQGSLRVILNTKIWPGMTVERASSKGVRITAVDGETIRVYLIMTNPKDAEQIFSAIDWRVQQQKVNEQEREAWLTGAADSDWSQPQESSPSRSKRTRRPESPDSTDTVKKPRYEPETRRVVPEETSNDSSTVDPETEVSSESFTSSPVVKSSPSTTSE